MHATCRLYLITPPAMPDPVAFAREFAQALAGGDVAALQIRLKGASEALIEATVRAVQPMAQRAGVALIMNDRPDLAVRLGCDGVHVGQQDTPVAKARHIVGPSLTVGATCHDSRHLAMEAAEAGADYVAFGAYFPTRTKDAPTRADLQLLSDWQETMLTPCVAIGGIDAHNARGVVAAGADFIAVSAGVWSEPHGPEAAVVALNAEIAKGLADREKRLSLEELSQ